MEACLASQSIITTMETTTSKWYLDNSTILIIQYCRVLVGAPEAQTEQHGIDKGGAIYECGVEGLNCSQIIFDSEGNVSIMDLFKMISDLLG